MNKILIIGQAPGPGRIHKEDKELGPISGQTGRRLADLMGMTFQDYLQRCDRINLLKHHLGKRGKGDHFDDREARFQAEEMMMSRSLMKYNVIILLGAKVGRAFKQRDLDGVYPVIWRALKYTSVNSIVLQIPHPSGVNRWYNCSSNRHVVSNLLISLIKDVK